MRLPNQFEGVARTTQSVAASRGTLLPSQERRRTRFKFNIPPIPPIPPLGFKAELPLLEIKCNGSCLCNGAEDCVDMLLSGCCGVHTPTCGGDSCSCVNTGGCDHDGKLPD